jgi:hypothetical protein
VYFNFGDPIGAVAQLGERRVRNAEVEGSIPFRSIEGLWFWESGNLHAWVEPRFRIVPITSPSMVVGPMAFKPCGLATRLAGARALRPGFSPPLTASVEHPHGPRAHHVEPA